VSIRRRLTIGVTAIVLGCLAVAFAAVYAGTGGEVRTQLDGDLRGDMDAFSRVLGGVGGGDVGVRSAAVAFVRGQPYAPNARLLYVRLPGQPVVTNDPDLVIPNKRDPGGERARRILRTASGSKEVALPDGARIRLLVRRIRTAAGVATVGVGESTRLVDRAQDGVLRSFLLAGLVALVLAVAAALVLSTRIARPLRRMAGVAARIEEGDLGPRMAQATAGDGDDITVLAEAFDSMLDRLQVAFDRQNAFVADASHELRTPLTVIRGQLEVLALDTAPGVDEVRRVDALVRTEVDRMSRMVEDLLMLARAQDATFLRPAAVPIPTLTEDLLDAQRATAERDFQHEAYAEGTLRGDPDRVAQAIRNLLRNAIEHTGEGGLVRLWVRHEAGRLVIGVDDDGPGIPDGERQRVFNRFHRADAPGPRGTGTGTGLGLAIVQAIALAHGGEAWVGDSPAGGARVAVSLPGFTPRTAEE
jgi:two-component system OmpR family sensor kinase